MILPAPRALLRSARRAPAFTAAAVLTLGVGLAGLGLTVTLLHGVLLRPLPYPRPDQLVSLSHTLVVGGDLRVDQSDASLIFYERHGRALAGFGGYRPVAANLVPSTTAPPERVVAARVTSGFFPTLGVPPLVGRTFTPGEDGPGGARVVVMSERLWTRRFGADRAILGRTLDVDGAPHTVIGVMPASLRFPEADTALWLPLRLDATRTDSASFDYQAIGRLRDDASIETAAGDLQSLLLQLPQALPGRLTRGAIDQTHMRASVRPLAAVVIGDAGRLLWLALGAAAFVFVIACANAGNLFLVRSEAQRRDLAVRRALGAGTPALAGAVAGDALAIALAAAVLALGAVWTGVRLLQAMPEAVDLPRLSELGLDGVSLAVTLGLAVVAAALVAAVPLARLRGVTLASVVGTASRSNTGGAAHLRTRHALVVVQVALALVLLAGSGLMLTSLARLRTVPLGFNPAHALSFRVALPSARYPAPADAARVFAAMIAGIQALPGIDGAGAISKLPLDPTGRTDSAVFVEDRPMSPGALPGIHPLAYATPGYFAAAGIPFAAGRTFTAADPPTVVREAVVSSAFAARYWSDRSPLGRRIRILANGPWYTIVGVVASVRDTAIDQPQDLTVYCPLLPPAEDSRWAPRDVAVVARTAGEPAAAIGSVRDAVRGIDRSVPLYRTQPLDDVVSRASARRSVALWLLAVAAGAALLLGAVGLYGVMSYVVALRRREMGIRVALGARPAQVLRLVWRQGLLLTLAGLALGLAASVFATRLLTSLLFDVRPGDPVVLAGAAALLLAVAAVASLVPARRAARVDPAVALRTE